MSGVAALGWAARALMTNPVLILLAAITASTRVVFFLVGQDRLGGGAITALEALAGLSRLALVVAVLAVAQRQSGLSTEEAWLAVVDAWRALRVEWPQALIATGVVGLAAGAANGALWWLAGTVSGGGDTPAMLATVSAVKNLTIIPVFTIALLVVWRCTPAP